MPTAEIIAIGTELVLGQIVDTNTSFLAKNLNKIGVDVFRTSIVGDNPKRISQEIIDCLDRADIVITTGGLGPTVDDPTREAVGLALGIELEFRDDLWLQITERFKSFGKNPTENNKRQAFVPEKAIAIENPVGTAPAFKVNQSEKVIICLPGVPYEMKYLFDTEVIEIIKEEYSLNSVIYTRVVHTTGIGESTLDEIVGDLEKMENPTVGLAAHPGQVDIRITAKAANKAEAIKRIEPIVMDLENRLGGKIYGFDETSLSEAINRILKNSNSAIALVLDKNTAEWKECFIDNGIFSKILIQKNEGDQKKFLKLYDKSENLNWVPLQICADDPTSSFLMELHINGKTHKKTVNTRSRNKMFDRWLENIVLNFIWETFQSN